MSSAHYIIYGNELSYFTRKLEAALLFYGAGFELRHKSPDIAADIEARSGTHQVPVLQTPEDWMIADTTPLIQMLDGRFPKRAMFPPGSNGVLVHLLEEYFDEWIARTMVHYRWHYEESAVFASEKMTMGNREAAARVRAWGPRACRATGTDSKIQQQAAEDEYLRLVDAMEKQLAQTRYLLGDRPTALGCVVLGGLRAHTNMDPTPKAQIAAYPRVVHWAETATTWDGEGELPPFEESTGFARHVLGEMSSTYVPYVIGNRAAQAAGARAFHADIYGEAVSYLSRPYPERSRQMICDRIASLSDDARADVRQCLAAFSLDACFDS